MKAIKYILFILIITLGVSSCDFLDKEPTEIDPKNYFNTDQEVEMFLIGIYSPLMQEYFYGNNYAYSIAGGDDLSFYQRKSPLTGGSILCANANSGTTDISNYWRVLYDGINRANILLENIDKEGISEATRVKAKAEAIFMRAFYYFNLIQGWGDVPLRLKSYTAQDNPMMPKTDKQVIYDRVIEDIKMVLPDLPDYKDIVNSSYLSKAAAQGILARIYLFRAGEHYRDGKADDPKKTEYLKAARDWAYEIIKTNDHDLVTDYSRVFLDYSEDLYNSTKVKESIWEVAMAGNRSSAEQAAGRIGNTIGFGAKTDYSGDEEIKGLTGMNNPGYSYRFIYASLKLYEMYEAEGDVERSTWNIAPFEYLEDAKTKHVIGREYYGGKKPVELTEVDGMPCTELALNHNKSKNKTRCAAKYRREYEVVKPKHKNYTPINFPILRYSDVLLMYAEAENELNGPENAIMYVQKVRDRAKLTRDISGLGQSDLRETIKNERAMELCFEGIRRWDLIRWGEFYTKMREMTNYVKKDGWDKNHDYAEEYYKVTPSYVYFPIPDTERSKNPIAQNKGW